MAYLLAIVALGALISLHELGHLLAARLFGVRVLRFSIGFGPPIFTLRRGGTEYVVCAVPLGGYVRIHGMNPHENGAHRHDRRSYASLSPWKRMAIIAGGPLVNYVIGYVLMAILFMAGTHVPMGLTLGTVEPGSEAARAQLRPGDQIQTVDGEPVAKWAELVERTAESGGKKLTLGIVRGDQVQQVEVTPREDEDGVGRIGVSQQYGFDQQGPAQAAASALVHTQRLVAEGAALTWRLLHGRRGVAISSPLAIVRQMTDAASSGFDAFIRVVVSLSVALAVFNLLPFPALDGGRLVFLGVEAARGRPASSRIETAAHAAGFLLLMALLLWVAVRDVRKLWQAADHPASTALDGG